ncbi:MAG: autotransporter domain-containing protein [Pseudomonadota bacterium]
MLAWTAGLRRFSLMGVLALSAVAVAPFAALGQDSTWLTTPGGNAFNTGSNWTAGVPTGTATFGATTQSFINVNGGQTLDTFHFVAGAPGYTFIMIGALTFNGAGILNDSSNLQEIYTSGYTLTFNNSATTSSNTYINVNPSSSVFFNDSSSPTFTTIENDGSVTFSGDSRSVVNTISLTSGSILTFTDNSSVINNLIEVYSGGQVQMMGNATTSGSNFVINDGASLLFADNASGGNSYFSVYDTGSIDVSGMLTGISMGTINGTGNLFLGGTQLTVGSRDESTTFSGIIQDGGLSGGTGGSLVKVGTGILTLTGTNTYTGGTTITGGMINFAAADNFGTGTITLDGGGLQWATGTTTDISVRLAALGAGGGTFDTNGNDVTLASGLTGIGGLTKAGAGTLTLGAASTYGGATAVNGGTLQAGAVNAFSASSAVTVAAGATLALNSFSQVIGSLAGAGSVTLGSATLTAGGDNSSTTFSGTLSGSGGLVKTGAGTMTLAGVSTYTGGTTVTGGTLQGTTSSLQGNIVNNASVVFDQTGSGTYAGVMSGTGSLTLQGGGTLILAGTNSYSGGTTVTAGTLQLGSASAFPSGGALTVNGGTFALGNNSVTVGALSGSGGAINLGAGTLTLDSGAANTLAAAISGTGGLTLQGGGTLVLSGSNTYTGATSVDASTLIVNGSLSSSVTLGNGGRLGGSGSVGTLVANNAVVAPGNSIGTLNVNGGFTQNGGSYVVEVNAGGQSDRINVAGVATINGVAVQVVAAPGTYATRTTYTILSATGGVSGTYSSVTSNFAFLTPSLSYGPNDVLLTLALQGSTPFSGFGGNTPNQQSVGRALDQSYAGATGDFATVIGALANLSTTQASPALDAISGQPYADFGTVNVSTGALFMNALGQQMAGARAGAVGTRIALADACGIVACDGASLNAWTSVLGGLGSVLGNGNTATLTYNAGGVAAGMDYRFDPRFLAGLGVGYAHGTQWVNGFMGQGWTDSVSVAAYGSFTQWGLYVDALAGYAYSNNQQQRQIVIPGLQPRTASGSTGANQFLGQAETGYKLGIYAPAQATITPFGRLQVSSVTQNAFTESGASSLNLNVAQQTTNSVRSTLGADVGAAIGVGGDRTIDLALRLGWQHEFADTARPITAAFAGAPGAAFTVYGATPQSNSAVVGFSARTTIAANTSLYLRYNGEVGGGTDNHSLSIGGRFSW